VVSLPSTSLPVSLKNFQWNGRNRLAVSAVVVLCWGLLDGVLYCDTTYQATFGNNRATLTGLYLSTFWNDLRNQFHSLFAAAPVGSLAGEITTSEWTQCLLVPPIVIYLVWFLWPRLRDLPVRGHPAGYAVLGAGLLLYLLGYMAENYYVGVVSLQLIYAGLIILMLGWAVMRQLLFPWAFLLFMWPYGFFEDVAFQLRLLMSSLSHHVLLLIGVNNMLNGTAIISPPGSATTFAIDIADPCSGIRSLFALVMIASLYAFISFKHTWQKAVIVIASVPLVILGNLVRIVILTLANVHFGETFALGANDHPSWFHETAGYLVYFINFGGLIMLGWGLSRLTPESKEPAPVPGVDSALSPEIDSRASLVVFALAVLTVGACWLIPPATAGDDTGVVMDLPDEVGPLIGFSEKVSQAELSILPPDTTFARKNYGLPGSDRIDRVLCSIVLSGAEKRSIHRPERCLPGQGWSVLNSKVEDVPLASGQPLAVTSLLLSRPVPPGAGHPSTLQSYYLYWYVGRNVSTPFSFERVLLTNWDLIVHRANQRWAYVIVSGYITEGFETQGRSPEQTLALLKAFIHDSVPTFMKSQMPGGASQTSLTPKPLSHPEDALVVTGA